MYEINRGKGGEASNVSDEIREEEKVFAFLLRLKRRSEESDKCIRSFIEPYVSVPLDYIKLFTISARRVVFMKF